MSRRAHRLPPLVLGLSLCGLLGSVSPGAARAEAPPISVAAAIDAGRCETLGSMSLGQPTRGAILNAVPMPESEDWTIVSRERAFGTSETIEFLITAIRAVKAQFPTGTHPLDIGHISYRHGGPMRPHRSHQSGRDVDLGYYYIRSRYIGWYQPANEYSLDAARTWAFLRALVTLTDVEYIFIDARVQRLLKRYALARGEDKAWLDTIFQSGSRHPAPLIRHANGHRTHMHVRFYNPRAQALAHAAHPQLLEKHVLAGKSRRIALTPEPKIPARRLPQPPEYASVRASVAGEQN